MKVKRIVADPARIQSSPIQGSRAASRSILGNNRDLMRHSDGSLHVVVVDGATDTSIDVYGRHGEHGPLTRLSTAVGASLAANCRAPATDSNQNGVYIAFAADHDGGTAGYVAHIRDIFGDGENVSVHGPLTPGGCKVTSSFLQASRGFNSLVFSWVDVDSGRIYAGVSKDGVQFPAAKLLVEDKGIVDGAASGAYGDLALLVFRTTNPAFAPEGYVESSATVFSAYVETGDGGDTWSDPARLVADVADLPRAVTYAPAGLSDLKREELELAGAATPADALQVLVWETMGAPDKRIFALSGIALKSDGATNQSVGVLTWKPAALGAGWKYVLVNQDLVAGSGNAVPAYHRGGSQYKYCALPGSSIRVINYVNRRHGSHDDVVMKISVNMGDSFDYEGSFSAAELQFDPHAELAITNSACTHIDGNGDLWQDLVISDLKTANTVRHVVLPVGINVTGMDPTLSW